MIISVPFKWFNIILRSPFPFCSTINNSMYAIVSFLMLIGKVSFWGFISPISCLYSKCDIVTLCFIICFIVAITCIMIILKRNISIWCKLIVYLYIIINIIVYFWKIFICWKLILFTMMKCCVLASFTYRWTCNLLNSYCFFECLLHFEQTYLWNWHVAQ